ncbi:hypothetical protein LJC58_03830 [Lachnospiraceae bacterium OttesenSCG-928-D06]|nr:hypothetical protein [Lachnospiraceae bacterium OttesenSCG-928-D06]
MSNVLRDIGLCKNRLITSIISSTDVCELLLGKDYAEQDVENLIYTQVFPYLYVDETQTKELTYLCVEVDVPNTNTTIKEMKVIIWVYCHKGHSSEGNLMRYSKQGYSGTRIDILSDMIERKLSNSFDYGIGKLHLDMVTHNFPHNKYYGRQLIFSVPNFKS